MMTRPLPLLEEGSLASSPLLSTPLIDGTVIVYMSDAILPVLCWVFSVVCGNSDCFFFR
jgi:hypothetical protein